MESIVLSAAWRRGTLCSGWMPRVFGSALVSKDEFALLLRAAYFGHGQQVLALPDHATDGKCFGNFPGRGPVQIRWVPWAEPERPSENSFGDPRRPQPRLRPAGAPSRGGLLGQDYLACCFSCQLFMHWLSVYFVAWHPRTLTGAFTDAFWPRPTLSARSQFPLPPLTTP